MLRTTALIAILLCLCSCTTPPAEQAAERPPNFVLIFIDDMGYGDIGPFGSTVHRTPHLDRMAAEGLKLTSFYAAPVCTPSRASLMTGSYPIRNGLQTCSCHPVLMPGDTQGIHADEIRHFWGGSGTSAGSTWRTSPDVPCRHSWRHLCPAPRPGKNQ